MEVTIGDYLLMRLGELGIKYIFGVPGDYNLGFLDQICNNNAFSWVGNCNELNAAYAADGYARINGASALVTTFGVGELSAMNGIAGAYAEYAFVVNIVGTPATSIQQRQVVMHHTLGDKHFNVFAEMFRKVTIAQTLLSEFNPAKEIDRVLTEGWLRKRPVYIGIPTDISYKKINIEKTPLNLQYPTSNVDALQEAVERTASLIEKAKSPVFLVDLCALRHPMKTAIETLIAKTEVPIASLNMGKGMIDESNPHFIGMYNGDYSAKSVQARVESSDCVISFGTLLSDFNTGGFTTKFNTNVTVEIHSHYVNLKNSNYPNLYFHDFIPALTKRLANFKYTGPKINKTPIETAQPENQKNTMTQDLFWNKISQFLSKNDIVIAEAGTSLFGSLSMRIPDGASYISQVLWGSIGYTVGATLGSALAAPKRQVVLFVGDGSFQLTAQELSTMIKCNTNPIIFLINNDGYTIERVIHGPTMEYNNINMWKYSELPKIFGDNVWTTKVETIHELETALTQLPAHPTELRFVEVLMGRNDAPAVLKQIGADCAKLNAYN